MYLYANAIARLCFYLRGVIEYRHILGSRTPNPNEAHHRRARIILRFAIFIWLPTTECESSVVHRNVLNKIMCLHRTTKKTTQMKVFCHADQWNGCRGGRHCDEDRHLWQFVKHSLKLIICGVHTFYDACARRAER